MEKRIIDNRYEVIERLGQGLWGEVYKVLDLTNQNTVALKIVANSNHDAETGLVMKEEFRRLSRLRHPHIIKVFDFGILSPNSPYYTMEYMPGGALSLQGDAYNESLVLEILARICLGLQYIHARGFVHGDIKPGNILVRSSPQSRVREQKPIELVLSDLSLSPLLWCNENDASPDSDQPVSGSFPFIAPELLLHRRGDYRADLFSLGVLMYYLTTEHFPFHGQQPGEMIKSILTTTPLPPSRYNNRLSEQCEFIILRLLEKEPLKRFHSARDVLNTLAGQPDVALKKVLFEHSELAVMAEKFVGRDDQLNSLRDMLGRTREGQGQTVLVYGETGIGKSCLVDEVRVIAQLQGMKTVSLTSADDRHFMEPIRRLLLQLGYGRRIPMREIVPGLQAKLDAVFSVIPPTEIEGSESGKESSEQTFDDRYDRQKLFEAVLRFIESIMIMEHHSDSQAVVQAKLLTNESLLLIFEDIHQADRPVLEFFEYLGRNNSELPLMVLATFRDDDVPLDQIADRSESSHPAMQLLSLAETIRHAHGLRLPRFTLEESSLLITSFLEISTRPGGFVRQIHELTSGNPLHIMEVLRYLLENNILSFEQGNWWIADRESFQAIPKQLRIILERRYERLSELQRSLLQKIALFEHGVTLSQLVRIADRDRVVLQDLADDLTRWHILSRVAVRGASVYRLPHQLFRTLVLEQIKATERESLHRAAAGILMDQYNDGDLFLINQIIWHYRLAGDRNKTFQLAVDAAGMAMNCGSYDEALGYFEIAGSVMPADLSLEQRLAIDENFIITALKAGQHDRAISLCDECLKLIDIAGHKDKLVRMLNWRGVSQARSGEYRQALATYREALTVCDGDAAGTDVLPVLKKIAGIQCILHDFKTAEQTCRIAMGIAEQQSRDASRAYLFMILGRIAEDRGEFGTAQENYRQSLSLYDALGDEDGLHTLYNNLGTLADKQGDWRRAIEFHRRTLDIRRQRGDLIGEADSLTNIASANGMRGDWKEAFTHLHQALELYRRLGHLDGQMTVHHNLGELSYRKGEYREARSHMQTALEFREQQGDQGGIASSYLSLATVALRQNELESAQDLCNRAQRILRKIGMQRHLAISHRISAEIYFAQGNYSYALRDINRARKILESVDDIVEQGNTLRVYGDILHQMGDVAAAQNAFEQSLSILEKAGASFETGQTYLEMGERHLSANKIREAGQALDRARQVFEELKSHDLIRRVDIVRAELQARVQPFYLSLPADQEHLKSLIRVSHMINTIHDTDILLQEVLDIIISTVNADRGAIFLRDRQSGDLVPQLIRNLEQETVEDATQLSRSIAQTVVRKGEPIYITDTRGDSLTSTSRSIVLHGITAVLCVPLQVFNELIGVIYLDSRSLADIFLEQDIQYIGAFASMAALAIVNGLERDQLIKTTNYYRIQSQDFYREHNFIAHSNAMNAVMKTVAKIASSSSTVLITGESGTGKEMIARLVHSMGTRRDKLFLPYFCGNAPETLIDSELFGHVKGAFSGADLPRKGLFQEAEGGTVFLDEIGDIGPQVQAKLLRFLQEREIKPLGSNTILKVNVRVIAATNRDLHLEIKRGNFRQDLLYRLNVITLTLPPLRERKDDIPHLVTHFIAKYSRILNRKINGISKKAMERFLDYTWPGNVRELENQIELAVNLVDEGGIITEAHLRDEVRTIENIIFGMKLSGSLKDIMAHLEREFIVKALVETKGNKTRTAKRLGLTRQTLNQKLKLLDIQ